ncbi:MAG: amidohydrolase family protein [Clostridiales Family XIII bacterium]|jgi:enamidase|nr:amidohydrolase family protein [Clostridiales Family XIII bacterium]
MTTLLKNAFLIDGTGAAPAGLTDIVLSDGKIKSVELSASGLANTPDNDADTVFDLRGKTVLPGLIDAHTHFGGTDRLDYPGITDRHENYDYLNSRKDALKWGITTVRSAGDYVPDILDFRDEVDAGLHTSPKIIAAGRMFQAAGGHPLDTVFGHDPGIASGVIIAVGEDTDLEKEVAGLADAGSDWIKVFISEVNKMDYPAKVPRIPKEKIKRIAELAHKHDKPCMIHVDNLSQLREAAEAGADSIEHIFAVGATDTELPDDLLELLKDRGTYIVPTMYSIKAHEALDDTRPPVYEKLVAVVARMLEAGIKITAGCDSGIPFVPLGESIHCELEELVRAGMSPMAAILAATSQNAKMLRIDNDRGQILPGKAADLVILGANPLEDIANTRKIEIVILNGRIVIDRRERGEFCNGR